MVLHELRSISLQGFGGVLPTLAHVQSYRDCQGVRLHEGGLIALVSTK